MSVERIGVEGALEALDGAAGVASLRVWMEHHRDEVLAHQNGRRINWPALCDWFASVGLLNGNGQPPSIRCAQLTWYRVGKRLERRNALEAEREAQREQARIDALARKQAQAAEKADIRQKMAQAEQELQARQMSRVNAQIVQAERVAERSHAPEKLVQEGDICPTTGAPWQFGADLPGYASKRDYSDELHWLRDVGRALRARHPTNLTMTPAERSVMRAARARIPNL